MAELPDSDLDWIYLVDMKPYDPDLPGVRDYFFATDEMSFDNNDPDAPRRQYEARVDVAISLDMSMFGDPSAEDPTIGGISLPAFGVTTIDIDDDFIDQGILTEWQRSGFDDRAITIRRGLRYTNNLPSAFSDFEVLVDGLMIGGNEYEDCLLYTSPSPRD